jgi:hypothetical protein
VQEARSSFFAILSERLFSLSRRTKRGIMIGADVVMLPLALYAALAL